LPRKFRAIVVILSLLAAAFAFSRLNRSGTVRAYYKFERSWNAHWPLNRGKDFIQNLEPAMLRLGVLGPARVKIEPGVSLFLDPSDLVPVTILRTREWQPEIWDSLSSVLAPGSVFLDVGAHIGYFSMKAAVKVGPTGRVVAFEPNPETLMLLRDNVAANKAENVTVEPIACTDREQMLTLYAAPVANTGISSLARSTADISAKEPPRAYSVRARRIDDVVRELKLTRLDAIKIDVEGAEAFVLRGAVETLKRFHPKVVMEVDAGHLANMQSTPEDLASILKTAGYNRSKPLNPEETDWEWTLQRPNEIASTVRIADVSTAAQLIRGFYLLEEKAWRWTARNFTVALPAPDDAKQNGARLTLKFTIPEVSLKQLKSMTLSAKVGNAALAAETFATSGEHEYRRDIPAPALVNDLVDVDFSLDKVLSPPATDRELGVIVTSITLEPKR
jgi:FkbM family methyltransferase